MDEPDQWLDALEFVDGLRYSGNAVLLSDSTHDDIPDRDWFIMQEGIQETLEGF